MSFDSARDVANTFRLEPAHRSERTRPLALTHAGSVLFVFVSVIGSRQKRQPKRREIMALVKRGKVWHCDFVVDDVRYRESLKTTDWREAQANEKQLIAQAKEGKLA